MNSHVEARSAPPADWRSDLEACRDVPNGSKRGFEILIDWFEKWRLRLSRPADRETANEFWRAQVLCKPRASWQIEQRKEAMRWYLRWRELCRSQGMEVASVPERMKVAVESAAARRGLALRTRKTYSGWAVRYGSWVGSARRAMDLAAGAAFLTDLVNVQKCSYATQRQALNSLVFFFRAVCGMEEVDLNVRLRKVPPKEPVVLDVQELLALIDKLTNPYQLAAKLQCGAGLRRQELVTLRIKDIDLKNRSLTVRRGKGQKDRVTVVPESLVSSATAGRRT